MGIFGGRKKNSRSARREPQLFERGNSRAVQSKRPARRRRSFLGWLFRFAFKTAILGTIIVALGLGYVWFSLAQKGLLQIPEQQPGIMLLAADGVASLVRQN